MKIRYWLFSFVVLISFVWIFSSLHAGNNFDFKEPAWTSLSEQELEQYDTLYAMSDIHGTFERFTTLLENANLIEKDSSDIGYDWVGNKNALKKTILILVGDYIGKENYKDYDPIGVILLIKKLQKQAALRRDKIIVLLGNHEAEFLADPEKNFKKGPDLESLIKHVHHVYGITPKDLEDHSESKAAIKIIAKKLFESEFGDDLKTFPIGAKIGSWLFAHSGYIDANDKSVGAYLSKITNAWVNKNYEILIDENSPLSSFLESHNWWDEKSKRKHMKSILDQLKLTGLVMGHDPDALRRRGEIALAESQFLIKLDTGMNMQANDSKGRLLQCPISAILNNTKKQCKQLDEKGRTVSIPIIAGY
ncbi:MAG: metallophosphoesterase [Bdellovibrio sp.]|nr:metallophosphoesterase [Bdellovibrio sp.]